MNDILSGGNASTAVAPDPHFGNRHGMIAGAFAQRWPQHDAAARITQLTNAKPVSS